MTDEELIRRLRERGGRVPTEAADRIEALVKEKERLHRTVDAAAKLGRIIGFLGDDEDRISAFIECCGPDLIDHARAVLAEFEGGKDE